MEISSAISALNVSLELQDDVDAEYTPYTQRPETYIVPVLFALIFVIGVLGNGTLVVVFLRHPNMRNVPNTLEASMVILIWILASGCKPRLIEYYDQIDAAYTEMPRFILLLRYILSLALADLLVIVTCVPFTSTVYTLESWPWGAAVCKLSETAKDVSIGVSVFTLTALSAERYCAIVNPLRKLQTKPLTVMSAVLIWVLASVCALPAAVVSNVQEIPLEGYNRTIYICSPFPPDEFNVTASGGGTYTQYNVVLKAVLYYVGPLCVIACFYVLMARRLQTSARDLPSSLAGPQSLAQARARRHVARMVLAFVLVFIACFLPYHVFMLWFHLNPTSREEFDENWHALRIVGFCLSFLNSCVNPIALYCVSGVFRQYFNRYLCCRNPRRVQRGCVPSGANCETSFNSTYRRYTQDTCVLPERGRSVYRSTCVVRHPVHDTIPESYIKKDNGQDFDTRKTTLTVQNVIRNADFENSSNKDTEVSSFGS